MWGSGCTNREVRARAADASKPRCDKAEADLEAQTPAWPAWGKRRPPVIHTQHGHTQLQGSLGLRTTAASSVSLSLPSLHTCFCIPFATLGDQHIAGQGPGPRGSVRGWTLDRRGTGDAKGESGKDLQSQAGLRLPGQECEGRGTQVGTPHSEGNARGSQGWWEANTQTHTGPSGGRAHTHSAGIEVGCR